LPLGGVGSCVARVDSVQVLVRVAEASEFVPGPFKGDPANKGIDEDDVVPESEVV